MLISADAVLVGSAGTWSLTPVATDPEVLRSFDHVSERVVGKPVDDLKN
jgi:hypothetical protein